MTKALILTGLLAALTPTTGAAQQFNEMQYTPEETTFSLFAPDDAKTVRLRLYKDGQGGKALKTIRMEHSGKERWTAVVKGDLKGRFYTFDMGRGESPGVFAKAVGVNGRRAAILTLSDTDPEGWADDRRPVCKSPADLVVYELHHRDFSIARNINLHPEDPVKVKRQATEYPGKFLALTEPWAISHLQALGVNAVHILPSYDYGSVDETRLQQPQYNWGYDPVNYNVPEGSYSTDPYHPEVRIREFKQMVQALHKAGIRVILDVVYNHTYDIGHSNFQRTYPDYFYRKVPTPSNTPLPTSNTPQAATVPGDSSPGYSNGSGCGNETASEQPMMRQFMLESIRHWIEEYHIDGFRFDLMGVHDIVTMNQIRRMVDEIDPTIYIYGEGWSAGPCALPNDVLAMKANMSQMPGIGAFSDELRDALRGPFSDDTKGGFLAGVADCEESLKFGIAGAVSHPQVDMTKVNYATTPWAAEPTQMMSYVSCHDDMCLTDRLRASIPGITTDELIRLDLLAQTAVFTSQGVPFLLSGEELLRTKQGVHNSFQSPDSINQLDWSAPHRYPQVLAYYRNLIALRRHHPAFRLGTADLVRKHLEFIEAPRLMVAFRLKHYAGRDDWANIYVILNASRQQQTVNIPKGAYTVVCRDGVISEAGLGTSQGGSVAIGPQSALILHD